MPRRLLTIVVVVVILLAAVGSVAGVRFVGPAAAAPAPAPAPATPPAPATRPGVRLTNRPAVAAAAADRERRVAALTRDAVRLVGAKQYPAAAAALDAALALDPGHVTNLYNRACLLALTGRPDDAAAALGRAAEAGWSDFDLIARDPDLAPVRALPQYQQLVARRGEYQKRAADRAAAGLRARFGDGYLYDRDDARKLVFATNTDAATLADLKAWLAAQAASQAADLFDHEPDYYVSVVLPSPADYAKIVTRRGVGGFYADEAKLLVCQRLGQTVTHEFTHALHAADLAPLGQTHPVWVSEGLASMYEAALFDGDAAVAGGGDDAGDGNGGGTGPVGRLVPRDNYRLNTLQNAARANRLIPLAALLTMPQPAFVQRAELAYGQASSVMLYLFETGRLKPFYRALKASYDRDPTGRAALEQVAGRPLAAFEAEWTAWMTARPRVPFDTPADGPVIGARLVDGTDGLRVEAVTPGGPAARAGAAAGDVLVGLADAREDRGVSRPAGSFGSGGTAGGPATRPAAAFVQVRDYRSFVPVLNGFKPGDRVVVRVRRGDHYLELPTTLARRSALGATTPGSKAGKH